MSKSNAPIGEIFKSIMDEVKPIQAQAKKKIKQTLHEKLTYLDLVSRQEFDQQKATLSQCEAKLAELEKQLKPSPKKQSHKKDTNPS